MNEKVDTLIDLPRMLENKINGIQAEMVEDENKFSLLKEEKIQLRNEMIQKTDTIVFQSDRQEQYTRENILMV